MASTEKVSWGTIFTHAASISTVIAALVAIFAFWYGYEQFKQTQRMTLEQFNETQRVTREQFNETQKATRESQAVELYVRYNELMKEGEKTPSFWVDNAGLSIAETIYILMRGDPGWEKTVRWMLSKHEQHLKRGNLLCDTFNDDFVKVMEEINQNVCAKKV